MPILDIVEVDEAKCVCCGKFYPTLDLPTCDQCGKYVCDECLVARENDDVCCRCAANQARKETKRK